MGFRKYILVCTVLIAVLWQVGNATAGNSYDDFIGTFVGVENGTEYNFVKIEKDRDDYMVREWSEINKTWSEPSKIENAERFLSRSTEFQGVIGFNAGMVLVLKVPIGWKYGRFTSKSGFALISDAGGKDGLDLYKKDHDAISSPAAPLPPRPPAMINQITDTNDHVIATVNGQPIRSWQVDAHALNSHLSSEDALEDLIDLRLVRAAAISHGFNPPAGKWDEKERARIESALAGTLTIDVPAPRVFLIIDHAWLKDSPDELVQAAGRAMLEQLRDQVSQGATIPEAYDRLKGDGNLWHIGDHEEYGYEIISVEARDLPEGGLSEIIPGDGGLHLYKIHRRKTVPASPREIRVLLNLRLRSTAKIVYQDAPSGEQPE